MTVLLFRSFCLSGAADSAVVAAATAAATAAGMKGVL